MTLEYLPNLQPDGTVNVRVGEDDKVKNRYVLTPGVFTAANTWVPTDLTNEPQIVKDVAGPWFTSHEAAYKAAHPFVPPAPLTPDQVRDATFIADATRAELVDKLRTATPAQIEAYVAAKVTSLATAKDFLIQLTKVLATMVRN